MDFICYLLLCGILLNEKVSLTISVLYFPLLPKSFSRNVKSICFQKTSTFQANFLVTLKMTADEPVSNYLCCPGFDAFIDKAQVFMISLQLMFTLTLMPTAFYDFLNYRGGGGIFISHPRKQC